MSTAVDTAVNGHSIKATHPRAQKLARSETQSSDALSEISEDGFQSGTVTPVPFDAPPSVRATSSARKQIRKQEKQRMFPSVDYTARVSYFDPKSDYRDFHGFFNLFWIGLAIMVITTMLRNIKETGFPFRITQRKLFLENIYDLGISDAAMTASIGLALPLHKLYARSNGWLRWNAGGFWVQSLFQAAWLFYWVDWPFIRDWTWTAQVYFTLHLLVMFMKMHSYAFYNGHLSEIKRQLDDLDHPEIVAVVKRAPLVKYPSTKTHLREFHENMDGAPGKPPLRTLTELRSDLAVEITSPLGHVTYPQNLTVLNFVDFIFCPTLCYELEYPRTEGRRFMEIVYKTTAVFGCIFLITLTTEEFVLPVLADASTRLHGKPPFVEGGLIFAETINRLLFPFMVIFLLVFLVIFEYFLGAMAEITCFADRNFYEDWWNSCDWLEFSREWNIPVHHFLRRHVFSASRNVFSRPVATFITFLISAFSHELIMGCITKKLRGYGAIAMMLQMPIVVVQRSRWGRGKTLLNNVLFWCSMILGLSTVRSVPPPRITYNARMLTLHVIDVLVIRAVLERWNFDREERKLPGDALMTHDTVFSQSTREEMKADQHDP